MSVKKIVYVTLEENELHELEGMAGHKLRKVVRDLLEWILAGTSKVFRRWVKDGWLNDSLRYLSFNCRCTWATSESLFYNFLSNPADINEVSNSTELWEIVVVGVRQKTLQYVLEELKTNWYESIDKKIVNHPSCMEITLLLWWIWNISPDVHALTLDLKSKKLDFFTATLGYSHR